MAIASGASPAFEWQVLGGQLHEGRYHPMTMVTITNVDDIVEMLSRGMVVYVSARADVRDAARAALRQHGVYTTDADADALLRNAGA